MNVLKKLFGKNRHKITSYADFWAWFQSHERAFHSVVKNRDDIDGKFFQQLSPALEALGHQFFYLTGMADGETVELVITAEGNVKNFVFVEELVGAAPVIPGWRFTAHKPALDITDVNIRMSEYDFNKDNLQFYPVEHADRPDEIELVVVHPALTEENKGAVGNGVYIFLDNYLGEVNFATTVDHMNVEGIDENQQNRIPISKLKDYLHWREKEFVEKYDGDRHQSATDSYKMFEATRESGKLLIGVINADLLRWDRKASHPWLLKVEIRYENPDKRGMPNKATYALLDDVEDELQAALKDVDGYLNVGRLTENGIRQVYFACRDFRKPSQVVSQVRTRYAHKLDVQYDIYKDKYWRTFNWLGIS